MTPDHLMLELRNLARQVEGLRAMLEQLQSPSRLSPAERELVDALAAVMGGQPFTSAEALEVAGLHVGERPRLARALQALGAATPKQLGERLRAIAERSDTERMRLVACSTEHGSRLWRIEGGALGEGSPSRAPGPARPSRP